METKHLIEELKRLRNELPYSDGLLIDKAIEKLETMELIKANVNILHKLCGSD